MRNPRGRPNPSWSARARTPGWFGALFTRQPDSGRAWMWIAVALVAIPIVLRLFATQWHAWSVAAPR